MEQIKLKDFVQNALVEIAEAVREKFRGHIT